MKTFLFISIIFITISLSYSQQWTIEPTWTFQGAIPFKGEAVTSMCLPATQTLYINTVTGSGLTFTVSYEQSSNCGIVSGTNQSITTSLFDGLLAYGPGGQEVNMYVYYWPHNNTLFIQPGNYYWIYTTAASTNTASLAYQFGGPYYLSSIWGTDGAEACCTPTNNFFAVSQASTKATIDFEFDQENPWCLLAFGTPDFSLSGLATGGGFTTREIQVAYFSTNGTLGVFLDSCAEYYTSGCGNNSFMDPNTGLCQRCSGTCVTCTSVSECTSCGYGYYLAITGNCEYCGHSSTQPACQGYIATSVPQNSSVSAIYLIQIIIPVICGALILGVIGYLIYRKYSHRGEQKGLPRSETRKHSNSAGQKSAAEYSGIPFQMNSPTTGDMDRIQLALARDSSAPGQETYTSSDMVHSGQKSAAVTMNSPETKSPPLKSPEKPYLRGVSTKSPYKKPNEMEHPEDHDAIEFMPQLEFGLTGDNDAALDNVYSKKSL
jgi:hypothetical protein